MEPRLEHGVGCEGVARTAGSLTLDRAHLSLRSPVDGAEGLGDLGEEFFLILRGVVHGVGVDGSSHEGSSLLSRHVGHEVDAEGRRAGLVVQVVDGIEGVLEVCMVLVEVIGIIEVLVLAGDEVHEVLSGAVMLRGGSGSNSSAVIVDLLNNSVSSGGESVSQVISVADGCCGGNEESLREHRFI